MAPHQAVSASVSSPISAPKSRPWVLYLIGIGLLAGCSLQIWETRGVAAASLVMFVGALLPGMEFYRLALKERALKAERDQARAELQAHREFMQRVLDAMPQTIFMKDSDSRYTFVNEAFCELRAMTREEILAGPISKMRDANGMDTESEAEDKQVFTGHNILKEEQVFHPESGQEIFRVVSKRLCHDEHGNALVVGSTQNVSLWRQAERTARAIAEEQQRQGQFLKFVLNALPFPVYVKDAQLRYTLVNTAFLDLMEGCSSDLIGRTAREITPCESVMIDEMDDSGLLARPTLQVRESTIDLVDIRGHSHRVALSKIAGRDAMGRKVIIGTYDIQGLQNARLAPAATRGRSAAAA
ncbi:MAG: PAS domain-containing protein [Rhodocyclaceae bacterium]